MRPFLRELFPCPPLCPGRTGGGTPVVFAAHPFATALALMVASFARGSSRRN